MCWGQQPRHLVQGSRKQVLFDRKAPGRIILKPALNADAATDFLASYDLEGEPLTDLTTINKSGQPVQGAPTGRLYMEAKIKDSQKVSMTAYVEGTDGDDSRKKLSEKVKNCHEARR